MESSLPGGDGQAGEEGGDSTLNTHCKHCGLPTKSGAFYCKLPKCQNEKRLYDNRYGSEWRRRKGVRSRGVVLVCEHCKTEFVGRKDRRFCLQTEECKNARVKLYKARRREYDKNKEREYTVVGKKQCEGWGVHKKCTQWVLLEYGDDARFKKWCPECRAWASKRDIPTHTMSLRRRAWI